MDQLPLEVVLPVPVHRHLLPVCQPLRVRKRSGAATAVFVGQLTPHTHGPSYVRVEVHPVPALEVEGVPLAPDLPFVVRPNHGLIRSATDRAQALRGRSRSRARNWEGARESEAKPLLRLS